MINIVSGLPRSGTSMMMLMLQKGGMKVLTDNVRKADEDNLKGYFEFERVKQLAVGDTEWLEQAENKIIKIISFLLTDLPIKYEYRVIFMERNMKEILQSQKKMMIRRGETIDDTSDDEMSKYFQKHLIKTKKWLSEQPNFNVLYVSYNEILKNPETYSERIKSFLELGLNIKKMVSAVDASLYRQKQK